MKFPSSLFGTFRLWSPAEGLKVMLRQDGKSWTCRWVSLLLLPLVGCVTAADQRVKEFNDDGVNMFSRGDFPAARDSFEAALVLTPQDPGLLYNLGQCYDRMGDWRKAEQYYLACMQLAPTHGDARQAQASLLYRTGRMPEANRIIQEWLEQQPNVADAYVLDAWRLRQDKALPQAQGRLQQALALEPNNRRALVEMGIVYELLAMPERGLALYERALMVDPRQPEIVDRVAQMRAKGIQRPLPD
jgi:tetratricopeptide (TPR) repeat protein